MISERILLSVVIPVYNSEGIIDALHRRLSAALGQITDAYEIIFVNDCSPDAVWNRLMRIAEKDPSVKAICLRKNVGYDNAIMAGLHHVEGAFTVFMDDDLQHAPEDIALLYAEIINGFDAVYANFPEKKESPIKRIGSWVNGKLAQLIIDKPPAIYLSPFKIVRKVVVDEIVKYDGPFPYIDGLLFQATAAIHQVPIRHHHRMIGSGGHGIRRSLRIMANFCTTFSILPLRIAAVSGMIISVMTCLLSLGLVIWKIWFGFNMEGWTSIILGILLMGGLQLMGLGMLGEYVGRIYLNINRKPQFVIKTLLSSTRTQTPLKAPPACEPGKVSG
jgi:undecaprenyl-phosphate 4-deoxy-4-formamido-L-arabinose transferase